MSAWCPDVVRAVNGGDTRIGDVPMQVEGKGAVVIGGRQGLVAACLALGATVFKRGIRSADADAVLLSRRVGDSNTGHHMARATGLCVRAKRAFIESDAAIRAGLGAVFFGAGRANRTTGSRAAALPINPGVF